MKDIDIIIENVEKQLTDLSQEIHNIFTKFEQLHYKIPISNFWSNHTLEDFTEELFEDEIIEEQVPTEEILRYLIGNMLISACYSEVDVDFGLLSVKYDKYTDTAKLDTTYIDAEYNDFLWLISEYKKDIEEVLPTKTYVGNCSKEFCELIVNRFWEREYERIQKFDFPPTSFIKYDLNKCKKEIKKLIEEPGKLSSKGSSSIIKYFHKSIIYANTFKSLSPYEGWQKIKNDPEVFKDFYRNRLRCSDWFKGKTDYLLRGMVMDETYGIGLSTSRKYQMVTYFKPLLAKYIVQNYLTDFNTVFDPFSGYSGRMLGVLSSGKNYIGQDLCELSVNESKEIYEFIKPYINCSCELSIKDTIHSFGKYDCLFTCSPYENIESWPGVKSVNNSCDKWIDICLSNYECKRYVFVTDDNIIKYKKYVKEEIINTSHLQANKEYIVVIDKEDLKNIKFDIYGETIETHEIKNTEYTKLGVELYNIFNQEIFNHYIDCPVELQEWLNIIYEKFNQETPIIRNKELSKLNLNGDNTVLLACSGGLDSIYQIIELREKGYNVIIYHCKDINFYEGGNSFKSVKDVSEKLGVKLIYSELHKNINSNYSKVWPENPIKNQVMLLNMIDYCKENNINKICMDGSWEFPIKDTTAGIDVADAPENYKLFLNCINKFVDNLEFIYTDHEISKFDKLKKLDELGLSDYIYSCLGSGRFNQYRHNEAEKKYGIKLFKNNCGCSCRKCAHHNLLLYYKGYKDYPQEFIDKCWKIMSDNGFPSRKMLFDKNIDIEQRIKNLFIE